MEKDFDFNRIGKRMPYKTPDGFFSDLEAKIWDEVRHEAPPAVKRRTIKKRITIGAMAIAASIVLLLIVNPFSDKEVVDGFSKVELAFSNLSNEDQAYMLQVYQEDIFMNE